MDKCEHGCGRRAVTLWSNDADQTWELCGKCSDVAAPALVQQDYALIEDERQPGLWGGLGALPPLPALSADPATH